MLIDYVDNFLTEEEYEKYFQQCNEIIDNFLKREVIDSNNNMVISAYHLRELIVSKMDEIFNLGRRTSEFQRKMDDLNEMTCNKKYKVVYAKSLIKSSFLSRIINGLFSNNKKTGFTFDFGSVVGYANTITIRGNYTDFGDYIEIPTTISKNLKDGTITIKTGKNHIKNAIDITKKVQNVFIICEKYMKLFGGTLFTNKVIEDNLIDYDIFNINYRLNDSGFLEIEIRFKNKTVPNDSEYYKYLFELENGFYDKSDEILKRIPVDIDNLYGIALEVVQEYYRELNSGNEIKKLAKENDYE